MRTVRTTRAAAVAVAFLLLLAACSDPQGTEPGHAAAPGDPGTTVTEAPGKAGNEGGGARAGNGDEGGGKKTSSGGSEGSSAGDDGSGSGRGSRPGERGSGGAAARPADYPSAGEYVYDQEGFERFCQGPSCDKEQLPETQTVTARIASRSGGSATVVTEAQSSESQTLTTTTRYTRDKALVTKVDIDFTYGGFRFAQTYEPEPPVESLLFPLEVGKSWHGRWDARTSGDYRIKVVGESQGVYKLQTVTNFRGDFSGRAQATVWVDAATRMPVKTDGQIAVASSFGEYSSDFVTTLRSGPGY